jgi:hypothetical protein
MKITTKYSVDDKVRFLIDEFDEPLEGVVVEVTVTISKAETEIWYRVEGPEYKSCTSYVLDQSNILKKIV